MKRTLKVSVVIVVLIILFALKTIWQSGAFKKIENHTSGRVQRIDGLTGVEDITVDPSTGIAYLSSDDRWAAMLRKQPVKGIIYSLDLNDSSLRPINLTSSFQQEDFHPHGISLFRTAEGKRILFVINHRSSGSVIEIFEQRNDSLIHRERITDSLIVSPNDVVGVGERKFYFTNDHNEKRSTWRMIKDFLAIGTGNVGYYDGKQMTMTAVKGLKYANGINVSPDGKKLYASATTDRAIRVYERDPVSGGLIFSEIITTGTGVDNIEVDGEGNLWVGCHPQMLKFLSHSKDEASISPSEVIKLVKKEKGYEQQSVYMNDGSEISASSVGAAYKNMLLIGPVFQNHILVVRTK